jgi:hypothetical protein
LEVGRIDGYKQKEVAARESALAVIRREIFVPPFLETNMSISVGVDFGEEVVEFVVWDR